MQTKTMVSNDETYEFEIISSFVKAVKDKNGDERVKVIKPQAIYRIKCLIQDITSVSEAFNSRGEVSKNRCYIFHRDYKDLLIRGGYKRTCEIVFPNEQEKRIGYGSGK